MATRGYLLRCLSLDSNPAAHPAGCERLLAEVLRTLDARGCLLLLSNSETALIRQLYEGYRIETVLASRVINSKASGRGKIAEVVVRNLG